MPLQVKTVKPAGGGDYSTLLSWNTAAAADGGNFWQAVCYGGGDLGTLTITKGSPTPSAGNFNSVVAAAGEQHVGVVDTNKAKILVGAGAIGINPTTSFFQMRGIQLISNSSTASKGIVFYPDGVVDACLFSSGVANKFTGGALNENNFTGAARSTVTNNVFWMTGDAHAAIAINGSITTGTSGYLIANNTVIGSSLGLQFINKSKIGTASNNVFLDCTTACVSVATATLTQDHNLSTDATASGTGSIPGATSSNVVVNTASDLSLKSTTPANPAIGGAADLSATFTNDVLGNTRTPPWDIGAFKYTSPSLVERSFPRGLNRGLCRGMA